MVFKTISFPQCFKIDKYQLIIVALKKNTKQANKQTKVMKPTE